MILARLDALHIDFDVTGAESVIGSAAGDVGGVGARDQRFRWCAAGIDAGAAEASAFDDGNFHSRTGQPSCEWWPGLPGSDDDRVVGCHFCLLPGVHVTVEMPQSHRAADHGATDARTRDAGADRDGSPECHADDNAAARKGEIAAGRVTTGTT